MIITITQTPPSPYAIRVCDFWLFFFPFKSWQSRFFFFSEAYSVRVNPKPLMDQTQRIIFTYRRSLLDYHNITPKAKKQKQNLVCVLCAAKRNLSHCDFTVLVMYLSALVHTASRKYPQSVSESIITVPYTRPP